MTDTDELYRELGRKIRGARECCGEKLSQEKLAKRLKVSRASIVNIEAGRQHAPLHLLWKIAEALGTDLALLIPRRQDLLVAADAAPLDKNMVKQIEDAANGNPETLRVLTGLVSKLKTTIETQRPIESTNEQKRTRK
jgi:transcriptional regulator with XRE-family HTH domain